MNTAMQSSSSSKFSLNSAKESDPDKAARMWSVSYPSVAFVTTSLSARAGGLASTVPSTVNALTRLGVNAGVFGLADGALDPQGLPYECSTVRTVGSWPTPFLRLAPALDRALADSSPDVFHLHGLWLYPSVAAVRWRWRTGRPVIVSAHGMLDPWALGNSAWKKRLALSVFESRNLKAAACLHALNRSEMSAYRALGLKNPVTVIPNGVDLPAKIDVSERPEFLAHEPRRVLLFLGRMHPKKGLVETICAWSELQRYHPSLARDWVLVLAGWDDHGHVDTLKKYVADLDLVGSVRFPGPVFGREKERLLSHAEAFILASHSEGQPMAVLEAWAHSVPVLMTRACNLPEGFEAGAAIEIPIDPRGMASILAGALSDPSLPRLGEAGQKLVAQRFAWSSVAHKLAAVYSWVVGRGPRPDWVDLG